MKYSPRVVFLPMPVRDDVAAALRDAGHRVTWGSLEAFEASDAVVIAEISASALYYAGLVAGRGLVGGALPLLLLLADGEPGPDPEGSWALIRWGARATAPTVAALVELLGHWDPVALKFDRALGGAEGKG
ncbi:MAG: hypothetical protein JWM10_3324 [Myxococcaceae bacterium]|nr:hypothetical protein [Myxococcaceae bacterium]